MTKDNHFQQYGYDHYLKSPKRPQAIDDEGGSRFGPGLTTAALLLVGAVFAGVIVMSYPSANNRRGEIPIVKADLRPIKSEPEERGGMDIPNSESTILARVGEAPIQGQKDEIENLLDSPDEAMPSKEQAMQEALGEEVYRSAEGEVKPQDVIQKIDENSQQIAATEPASGEAVDPMTLHRAGTSPETKDFVQSVLNKEKGADTPAVPEVREAEIAPPPIDVRAIDIQQPDPEAEAAPAPAPENLATTEEKAEEMSQIEPTSGLSSAPKFKATSGTYYVQLASIQNRGATEKEWRKLQKKYGATISELKYRVQEASLDRGTFYRIQAGPISKDSADEICREIKAITPVGCLVVKK
ncbi:MAG: SPOR domain-containing protein [Alphaproteobacteria bacterium]|nr:SPOR domain-containing protein [Alphaproteobacteria bacterium]QQS56889.1 MAG: SPOR domain-containing protein [Alphaproteobacteria bacterium]